jgi:hypothetical protein
MNTLAEQPPKNVCEHPYDRELRYRNDTVTWLAESLNGSMRSNFEFDFDGAELYGEDGQALRSIFDTAIEDAQAMAARNSGLFFELRRRIIERGELDDMKALAAGELVTDDGNQANTMVVVSDFPQELMDRAEDEGGYNVSRRQTMLRVIQVCDGKIKLTSQSLDGSQRQALESIYAALGKRPQAGEMLGQRIDLATDLTSSDLADQLRDVYDNVMSGQFGGKWQAGIGQDANRRPLDTYQFACAQTDLIDWFVDAKLNNPKSAESLRFKLAATAERRYERQVSRLTEIENYSGTVPSEQLISYWSVASGQALTQEMERAAMRAARLNKTYSGCGGTIRSLTEMDSLSTEELLDEAGYGNKVNRGKNCDFISKECPKCHKKNVKTTSIEEKGKTIYIGGCGCRS